MKLCPDCNGEGLSCFDCNDGKITAQRLEDSPSGLGGPGVAAEWEETCGSCDGDPLCQTCDGTGYVPDEEAGDLPHYMDTLNRRIESLQKLREKSERTVWLQPIVDAFINGWLDPWEIGWSLSMEEYNAMPLTLHVTVESLKNLKAGPWIKFLVDAGLKINSTGETRLEFSHSLYWHFSCRENPELPGLGLRISGKQCTRVKIGEKTVEIFETRCD